MKWVIRIFGSIIGLFLLAALIGFFSSSTVSIERSKDIYAQPDDIFEYIADLENHAAWSPWRYGESFEDYLVGGGDGGAGQQAVWTCQSPLCQPGTQEISVVHYPEFVQAHVNLDGRSADATYALMSGENSDGSVTILIRVDMDVGGFPYIQRLFKFREQAELTSRLDDALESLVDLIRADGKAK